MIASTSLLKLSKYYDGVDFIIADKLLSLQKKEEIPVIEENSEKIDESEQEDETKIESKPSSDPLDKEEGKMEETQ